MEKKEKPSRLKTAATEGPSLRASQAGPLNEATAGPKNTINARVAPSLKKDSPPKNTQKKSDNK